METSKNATVVQPAYCTDGDHGPGFIQRIL